MNAKKKPQDNFMESFHSGMAINDKNIIESPEREEADLDEWLILFFWTSYQV